MAVPGRNGILSADCCGKEIDKFQYVEQLDKFELVGGKHEGIFEKDGT